MENRGPALRVPAGTSFLPIPARHRYSSGYTATLHPKYPGNPKENEPRHKVTNSSPSYLSMCKVIFSKKNTQLKHYSVQGKDLLETKIRLKHNSKTQRDNLVLEASCSRHPPRLRSAASKLECSSHHFLPTKVTRCLRTIGLRLNHSTTRMCQ